MKYTDERMPQQFGEFAEHYVMFLLARFKKMRVARVDQIGADIIATPIRKKRNREKEVYAISVKARNIGDGESKTYAIDFSHVKNLEKFAKSFEMTPTIAYVLIDRMEKRYKIRVLIMTTKTLKSLAKKADVGYITETGNGYNLRFNSEKPFLNEIKNNPQIDYTETEFSSGDKALLSFDI